MQRYVELDLSGKILRGIEHMPENNKQLPLPIAVILPGMDGTKVGPHRLFTELSRRLAGLGIASIRYDFLGGGDSDGPTEDVTLTGQICQTIAIIENVVHDVRFDREQLYVIGFSTGGYVASIAASQIPYSVKRLVLLSPVFNSADVVNGLLSKATRETRYVDYLGNRLSVESILDWRQPRPESLYGRPDIYPLVINGAADRLVPPSIIKQFCDDVYKKKYKNCVIPHGDHAFRRYNQKQEVLRVIEEYLVESDAKSI